MHTATQLTTEDVTLRVITDLRYAIQVSRRLKVSPARTLTPARRAVLASAAGLTLGRVSNPLFYDETFRSWRLVDHKALLALALAGYIRVLEVRGDLPGGHSKGRVGAHAGYHYRLETCDTPVALAGEPS